MRCEGLKRHLAVLLFVLVSASLCRVVGFALDPKKAITQYVHDVWTVEDGLPQNSILAMTQTRDGYLWLGTWQGLVRFDGVRFTVFDRQNTSEIKSNYIYAFCEDRQGNLWIGTWGGLLRFRDGKFTNYTTRDGLSGDAVKAIYEDRQGNLWIGTVGGGLNRFSGGKFTGFTSKDGLASDGVEAIYEDRKGSLWVGTWGGLSRFKDGQLITYTAKEGMPNHTIYSICEDREGSLWFGTSSGLYRFGDGKFTRFAEKEGLSHKSVHSVFQDREGNLWIGTEGGGLNRFQNGKFTQFSVKDGLSHDTVWPIYEDREGSLWIGTWGGLNRFKDGILTVFTTKEGMSSNWIRAVYEDRDGSLWAGALDGGVNRIRHGKFIHYSRKDGLVGSTVSAIYGDRKGNVWIATDDGGLNRFRQGRFTNYALKEGVRHTWVTAIFEDREGALWLGTGDGWLSRFKDGIFSGVTTEEWQLKSMVSSIYEDRKGNLWIGTERGMVQFKDGVFTDYTAREELPQSKVNSIYEDREGILWIATRGDGLTRFKDGKFITYTTRQGLFDNAVTAILEDGKGNLWIGSFRGIFSVSKKELEDLAQGKIALVQSIPYGIADGLKSLECNSNPPAAWKGKNGRLWFPTVKGLVVVDPDNAKRNMLAPPVAIEQVIFQNRPVDRGQRAELPAGRRELEFHYTALSLLDPKKVRFKYRLEGYDEDWVEAGARRVAYYTGLSHGSYRFRVIACNNDGVWNETGAAFELYLKPHFHETLWFYLLCVLLAVAFLFWVGVGVHHRRVRLLKLKAKEQETFARQLIDSQENERKRIASELHDGLGQDLLVVKSSALLGLKMTEDGSPAKKQFDEISTMTSNALEDVREITHNLRPYHLDHLGLRAALEFLLEKVASSSEIRFSAEIDPVDGVFSKEAEMNLYRIVQEGINNIVKHSGATEAKVALKRDGRRVILMIEDNGRGFIAKPGTAAESRRRGFGLTGISERARMLGGKELIQPVPGQGTTITVTMMLEDERHED